MPAFAAIGSARRALPCPATRAPRALDHPASTHAPVRFTSVARVAVRSSASPLPARLCASLHAQCAPERFTAHARGTAPVQLKSTRHSRPLADRWAKAKECPVCSRLSATNCNTNLKTMSRCNCHANSRPRITSELGLQDAPRLTKPHQLAHIAPCLRNIKKKKGKTERK